MKTFNYTTHSKQVLGDMHTPVSIYLKVRDMYPQSALMESSDYHAGENCADSILIPVQAAYLPVKGLEQLIKTIGKVKRQINPKLEIEGILLTMVDNRTNYARDISNLLIENYGSRVRIFENSIPMSVRAAEISAEGVSIYKHDLNGKVASAYQSLTEEVLGNE